LTRTEPDRRTAVAGATLAILALTGLLAAPAPARAQLRWLDLVVTAGVSAEGYEGNLASATVPVVDSTDRARAAIGEVGFLGEVIVLERASSLVALDFDFGIRQFAASGFQVRDYAPREFAGYGGLFYHQRVSSLGAFELRGSYRARSVDDRPPMPLFLQPGFDRLTGEARVILPPLQGVEFDVVGVGERSDYAATGRVTQLDLLDRTAYSLEIGARWGLGLDVRFYAGLRESDYPNQASNVADDPARRDRTITVGAEWAWKATVSGSGALEGIVNRSNSRRPEYDAFLLRTQLGGALPWWSLTANVYGVLTGKSYVYTTPFARLVPGEEAENASVVYLELGRPVALNLDVAVRGGYTKAETEIGDSYYERTSLSLILRYRPILP
jgi:hypothetical protein